MLHLRELLLTRRREALGELAALLFVSMLVKQQIDSGIFEPLSGSQVSPFFSAVKVLPGRVAV